MVHIYTGSESLTWSAQSKSYGFAICSFYSKSMSSLLEIRTKFVAQTPHFIFPKRRKTDVVQFGILNAQAIILVTLGDYSRHYWKPCLPWNSYEAYSIYKWIDWIDRGSINFRWCTMPMWSMQVLHGYCYIYFVAKFFKVGYSYMQLIYILCRCLSFQFTIFWSLYHLRFLPYHVIS